MHCVKHRDGACATTHPQGKWEIMGCEDKSRLAAEVRRKPRTGKFAASVTELQRRKQEPHRKKEYERLNRVANDARVKSEQARLALEQHIAAHGC